MTRSFLILIFCLGLFQTVYAKQAPRPFAVVGFPGSLPKKRLRALLQDFVNEAYAKGFQDLGEEHDFDHGHLLFAPGTREPVAILYHTQELAFYGKSSPLLDSGRRNWIQWLQSGKVEDASLYLRKNYPDTASWRWFQKRELPGLLEHRTITARMLDPEVFGGELGRGFQWRFRRSDCGSVSDPEEEITNLIHIVLPTQERVCLALSQ